MYSIVDLQSLPHYEKSTAENPKEIVLPSCPRHRPSSQTKKVYMHVHVITMLKGLTLMKDLTEITLDSLLCDITWIQKELTSL